MIGRPLSPVSFAGARRRGRRRGLLVGAAVGAGIANSRNRNAQDDQAQYDEAPVQEAAPAEVDPIQQLQQLGQLHEQGILTDEEFAAQKAKILG